MASEENSGDRVFQKGNGIDPFYASGWDQMVSLISSVVHQNQFGNAHYSVLGNQIMGSSSNLVHFPSDLEMLPKITSFGSGSFSEMVSSFGQIAESGSHSNFTQNNMVGIQRASNLKDHCENSENGVLAASANRRRKRKVSVGASPKNDEEAQHHDTTEFSKEDDEKKQKFEQNIGDQTVKQAKDNSTSAELPKEDYIHVRARRGKATNSHSLAERVRREKISERMRLLQELVPGCNKITGKAVMIDEIINYVQSLQQQVEFLSMKLATVNPELNMDIERILSKDILHSRGTALGNGLALSSYLPFSAYPHRTFSNAPGTTSSFPLPHNTWNNNELQSILQLGFDTVHSVSSLGPNGMSKMQP